VEKIPTFLLKRLLEYHVAKGKLLSGDLEDEMEVKTLLGLPVTVNIYGDMILINNAEVVEADLEATNGALHIVDEVILPDVNALLYGLESLLDATQDYDDYTLSSASPTLEIVTPRNPGADEVTIRTNGMAGEQLSVTIMNYQGLQNETYTYELKQDNEELTIDMDQFPKGMYIIHTQIGEVERHTKLIK